MLKTQILCLQMSKNVSQNNTERQIPNLLNEYSLTGEGCLARINGQSLITAVKCEHYNYTCACRAKCPLSSINEGISVQRSGLNVQEYFSGTK